MEFDACESRITLNLRCSGLRGRDVLGRSDAFAIVYLDSRVPSDGRLTGSPAPKPKSPGAKRDSRWEKLGITETKPENVDPVFATSFEVPYFFERAQRLAIDVYDRDAPEDEPLSAHDFLGTAECPLPSLIRARGQRLELPLTDEGSPNRSCGTITLVAEEVIELKKVVMLDMAITDFKPRSRSILSLGKHDPPSMTISRKSIGSLSSDASAVGNGARPLSPVTSGTSASSSGDRQSNAAKTPSHDWIVVHGPEVSKNAPNSKTSFDFERQSINYQRLCLCDDSTVLRIDVFQSKKEKPVGVAFADLATWSSQGCVPIFAPVGSGASSPTSAASSSRTSQQGREGKIVGQLHLRAVEHTTEHSFLDYVCGGYEISLVIAIDFTASNGDPHHRGSLHFLDQFSSNEYEMAIQSVGEILAKYDNDQEFPAFGFGAKLPPEYRVPSHCFTLTGEEDATCTGIEGVLNSYRQTLYNVRASGPTVFAEIIRAAVDHVQELVRQQVPSYTIMLIITDGVINDMEDTVNEIVRASSLPLSIVVVGVGDADFEDMKFLDGDEQALSDMAERDIVQFVEFRRYKGAPEVLAAKVLEEIPDQVSQQRVST